MMKSILPCILLVAACTAPPANLSETTGSRDWQNEPAASLDRAFNNDLKRMAKRTSRGDAIEEIEAAGYSCIYGEAHETYPEPAAQCTRSFATRACQMDWEIFLTSTPARLNSIETIEGAFRRDCVAVDRDWPEPVRSAIDDQLAPP